MNFLENYNNNANPNVLVKGGVFETVLYNILNPDTSTGGRRKRITRKSSFKLYKKEKKDKKGKTRKVSKNKNTRKIRVIKKNQTLKRYNNKHHKIDSIWKKGGKVDIMNTMNEPLLTSPPELQKNKVINTNLNVKPTIIVDNKSNNETNQLDSTPNIVLEMTKNNIPILYFAS